MIETKESGNLDFYYYLEILLIITIVFKQKDMAIIHCNQTGKKVINCVPVDHGPRDGLLSVYEFLIFIYIYDLILTFT